MRKSNLIGFSNTTGLSTRKQRMQSKDAPTVSYTLRCRVCRCTLVEEISASTSPHPECLLPNPHHSTCRHFFIDPSSPCTSSKSGHDNSAEEWYYRASLGLLSGTLLCPRERCAKKVGVFDWKGLQCSCGQWVVPAFAMAKGKVDATTASKPK